MTEIHQTHRTIAMARLPLDAEIRAKATRRACRSTGPLRRHEKHGDNYLSICNIFVVNEAGADRRRADDVGVPVMQHPFRNAANVAPKHDRAATRHKIF